MLLALMMRMRMLLTQRLGVAERLTLADQLGGNRLGWLVTLALRQVVSVLNEECEHDLASRRFGALTQQCPPLFREQRNGQSVDAVDGHRSLDGIGLDVEAVILAAIGVLVLFEPCAGLVDGDRASR